MRGCAPLLAVTLTLLVAACAGPGGSGGSDGGGSSLDRARCAAHTGRGDCESDSECIWAVQDGEEEGRCLPNPPDCRTRNCPPTQTCAPFKLLCLPQCSGGEDQCCVPWHTCQDLDAGVQGRL